MWVFIKQIRGQLILALAGALLLTLSFPKTDQGWLAWIALVPLFLSLRQVEVMRHGFFIGFIFGLAHNLGLVYWTVHTMHLYGNLPMVQALSVLLLLAGYLSLFPAVVCGALVWLKPIPKLMIVCAPALWVFMEMTRGWLFTGFPWGLLGHSQYDHLWLIQVADLFGVLGVSGIIVFFNAGSAMIILCWLELPWLGTTPSKISGKIVGAVLICLMVGVIGYGIFRSGSIDSASAQSPREKVAVIQGNIDQAMKWDPEHQMSTTLKYRNLSSDPSIKEADLVIWPETATPFFFLHDKILSDLAIEGIKNKGSYFIIGSPSFSGSKASYVLHNSAYLMSPLGKAKGKYDKVHLVPFGEYVPLKKWLPFIDKMVAQVGDFKPGQKGQTFLWEEHRVGMLICYESIFPDLARAMVKNGANLLVNITNDAWFGRTSAGYQHLSMAVFRAVENRRYLARAANTGISGFIDPCGRILSPTPLFEEAAVVEQISMMNVSSLYSRWGDWPLAVLVIGLLSLIVGVRVLEYLAIVKHK